MRCTACNTDNPSHNSFCGACGTALALMCYHCGEKSLPTSGVCGACGQALDPSLPEDALQDGSFPPSSAERKQGTVLFADIVGSTNLIADLDPEEAMERLRPSVALMGAAARRFDGSVVRLLGDGIMAVFGAPRAQEAHALRACQAAIAIQRAFESTDCGLKVRIGLHSGELVILQDDGSREPVPHGVTIHLANRLEQMAEPGSICLTGDCYRLVRLHCEARLLGERAAKGFSKPIETYVLLGFKPAVASQQFQTTNLTPLQGRKYEIQQLWRALRRTENGEARVVGISGAAGTGKSRLGYEFAEWCRRRFIPVFEARALAISQAAPLQPVLEFLRLFFGIVASDAHATARNRIAQHRAVVGLEGGIDLPLLYQFMGIDDPEQPAASRDAKARQVRLLHIVRHMIKQSGSRTSLIVVEDLHWLDTGSAEFVAALVGATQGTQTMVVVNFRQAYTASWMDNPHYEQIPLGELDGAQTTALVERLVGNHPELRAISQRIVTRCSGNPFFAEELVRSLLERGILEGSQGAYRLGFRSDEDPLPATVQAVIGERIDGLLEQEKAILQVAAVIGKEFPLAVLEQVAGIAGAQLEFALDRLITAQLIQLHSGSVGREFSFRHPLIQEVAYNAQLRSRRRTQHSAVAIALQSHYSSRLDEFSALIAHHYESAGQVCEAATFAARAAIWIGSTNSAQAIQHWHQVRRLLSNQPSSPTIDLLRMRACGQIAIFGWREGMTAEEAKPFLEEAIGWARKVDNTMISLLLAADGRIIVASGGSADTYIERVREGLAIESKESNADRIATLTALLCHAFWLAGLLDEALAANDQALQGVARNVTFDEELLGLNVEQWMLSLRGRILVRLGRWDEAEHYLRQVLAIEHSLLDPAVKFIPHLAYVDLGYFRGDAALAHEHALRIGQIAESSRNPYLRVYALGCEGTAKCAAKDFSGATHTLVEGIRLAQTTRAALEFEPEMMASLADCHYQLGDFKQAATVSQEAIDVAQRRSARLAEGRASIVWAAAIYARDGNKREAQVLEKFDRAEGLIRSSGASMLSQRLALERARVVTATHTSAGQGE